MRRSKAKSEDAVVVDWCRWIGNCTAYALNNIQSAGGFYGPQEDVYVGMNVAKNAATRRFAGQSVQGKASYKHASQAKAKGFNSKRPQD